MPVIFPDEVTGITVPADRSMPRELWADLAVLTPALMLDMALQGRDYLAGPGQDLDGDSEPRLGNAWLHREILAERDELLLGVLREIDGEFAAEDMEVAVVFGAAHMPAVVRELTGPMGYRVAPGARWLTAIDFV